MLPLQKLKFITLLLYNSVNYDTLMSKYYSKNIYLDKKGEVALS
jgi:hypothetical protein